MAGPPDDDELLAQVAKGDRRAFALLSERHIDRAFRVALRLLGSRADAEDAVQEAFLRTWTRAGEWQPGRARFSTWLHRVVVNLCLDAKRKPSHAALDPDLPVADARPGAEENVLAAERERHVARAVAALPDRQRQAVSLIYAGGLSNAEAAAALGISVGALEQLLVRARRALRDRLGPEGGERDDDGHRVS